MIETRFLHESIANIGEADFVERLLAHSYHRSNLFNVKGIPRRPWVLTRVPLIGLPNDPEGDVDLLLCEAGKPESAIAVEVKRFRADVEGLESDCVNKLPEFRKGVGQANKLARIGFSQVYLWVVVQVDSRRQNRGQITYAGLDARLQGQIGSVISTYGLADRVGLLSYEFVQPMDHAPLGVGSGGTHLERVAQVELQTQAVTDWVSRRFKHEV